METRLIFGGNACQVEGQITRSDFSALGLFAVALPPGLEAGEVESQLRHLVDTNSNGFLFGCDDTVTTNTLAAVVLLTPNTSPSPEQNQELAVQCGQLLAQLKTHVAAPVIATAQPVPPVPQPTPAAVPTPAPVQAPAAQAAVAAALPRPDQVTPQLAVASVLTQYPSMQPHQIYQMARQSYLSHWKVFVEGTLKKPVTMLQDLEWQSLGIEPFTYTMEQVAAMTGKGPAPVTATPPVAAPAVAPTPAPAAAAPVIPVPPVAPAPAIPPAATINLTPAPAAVVAPVNDNTEENYEMGTLKTNTAATTAYPKVSKEDNAKLKEQYGYMVGSTIRVEDGFDHAGMLGEVLAIDAKGHVTVKLDNGKTETHAAPTFKKSRRNEPNDKPAKTAATGTPDKKTRKPRAKLGTGLVKFILVAKIEGKTLSNGAEYDSKEEAEAAGRKMVEAVQAAFPDKPVDIKINEVRKACNQLEINGAAVHGDITMMAEQFVKVLSGTPITGLHELKVVANFINNTAKKDFLKAVLPSVPGKLGEQIIFSLIKS